MRKQDHQEAETSNDLRLWTYVETARALPYLRAVVRSLREHWLELQQARRQMRLMDERPGRPDRQALRLREEAGQEEQRTEERFEETLGELAALGVFSLDPTKGLVLIPIREDGDVAWFVFDLFAPQGHELSRFEADTGETRHPLVEKLDPGLVDELFSSGVSRSRPE